MRERDQAWSTAWPWGWAIALFAIALWPRVFGLDAMLNIDAVLYWSHRIPDFWDGLASGEYIKTFQTHPGVTLMWASGLSQKAAGVLHAGPSEEFIVPGKLPVAVFGSAVVAASYALVRRLFPSGGEPLAILSSLALATEPFVVAQSRFLHVDTFFAGFAWLFVLCALLTIEERKRSWALAAGLFLGLGLLSRGTCVTVGLGVGCWFAIEAFRERTRARELATSFAILAVVASVTVFALWPTLWSDPVETIRRLTSRTSDMVALGHRVFFLGDVYQRDPGASYYLALFFTKLSPEMALGLGLALVGLVAGGRSERQRPLLGVVVSYAVLLLALMTAAKKGPRYMLPLYPPLVLIATNGFLRAYERLRARGNGARWFRGGLALVALLIALRAARLVVLHPMPIAWCPEYPGLRCERVVTMGSGEGLREIALYLREHHYDEDRAKVYITGYGPGLRPWYNPHFVPKPAAAEYFLRYLSEAQRNIRTAEMAPYIEGQQPVATVVLNGIRYAELFLGPAHPSYTAGASRDSVDARP